MYKKDFPIFRNAKFRNKPLVYLDSASSTQKPYTVINQIPYLYENFYANIHRGIYKLSEDSTSMYEEARVKIADFIGAKSKEIIFTKGTTDSINTIVYFFAKKILKSDDLVLLTEMEHHSNIVPWLILQKEIGFKIEYVKINEKGELLNLDLLLRKNPKILSITHISNVLGNINDVKTIIKEAKKRNTYVLIDGAQAVSHIKVDVKDLGCDFYVFSSHKMLGPTGVGVLYARYEILQEFDPAFGGGDSVLSVTKDSILYKDPPWKFEGGTPNFIDVIALGVAIEYIEKIGMKKISKYIEDISLYTYEKLSNIEKVKIFGDGRKSGIFSFFIENIHSHDIASSLDEDNIAIRAGHHCAKILMDRLNVSSLSRCSLYIYNDEKDINIFISSLEKTIDLFS